MKAVDVDQAVAEVASRLDRALSLEDLDGILLAYSSHRSTTDQVRTNFLLSKNVPADVSAWQLKHGIATAVLPVPVQANPELGMLGRVCVPLLARGFRVGYLWVLQEAAEESPAAILRELRAVRPELDWLAELLLDANTAESEDQRRRGARFLAACAGEPEAIEAVAGRAEVLGGGPWRLATLVERADDPGRATAARADAAEASLLQRLSALHATAGINEVLFSAGTETHAVLLLRDAMGRADQAEVLRRFGLEVSRRGGHAERPDLMGLSEPFADLRRLPDAYTQSKNAVQAAWVDGHLGQVVEYRGIGVYQFLAVASRDLSPVESMLFDELRDHDRNGELLPVLELLYDKDGSVSEVAAQLHLHRTSIYNRLSRIRAIIGVDPLRGNVRLELHLAMKARRWAGRPRL